MNSVTKGDIVIITSPISSYKGRLAEVVDVLWRENRVRLKVDGEKHLMWFFNDEIDK